MKMNYPTCNKADLTENYFGTALAAPYTWLRQTNDPEVLDFTARENAFTDAWFDPDRVQAVKEKLKASYVPEPVRAISPWKDGYLASRSLEGNYSVVKLDRHLNIEKTLFKRNDLPTRTPFGAAACPSDDNLLAIMSQVDAAPRPDNVIYDFAAGKILAILPMTFSGTWSLHKRTFYSPATKVDGERSITAIQQWDADTNGTTDLFVYPGSSIFGQIDRSGDGKYFLFSFSVNYSDQVFYSWHEETGRLTPINEGSPKKLTYVDTLNDQHYFVSLDDSDHGVLLAVPEGGTLSDAKEVYKEETGYMDSGFSAGGKLFVHIQECAASHVRCITDNKIVSLPQNVGALSPAGEEGDSKFFIFESFTENPQILKFDGEIFQPLFTAKAAGASDAEKKVHDSAESELVAELLFAKSAADDTKIPYYLVRRKDAAPTAPHPVLMYGYGGYNISMPPWSTEMVTGTNIPEWVRNGGLYVHCLLRGGNEYGPAWHEDGMAMKKRNCFLDFIGIAEKIIADGWTEPSRIAISGCSNGGLLMSSLVTMRPDLWGCVIDSVPHTDMIHFADDDRGPMYITEYGDPHHSKEEFEYLLSYSPVHNVRETNYPPVYIQTGECDNNVPPYHGKSFAATMQEKNTSDNPILLRVLKEGSHDRGQGEVYWQTIAEMRVFIETFIL